MLIFFFSIFSPSSLRNPDNLFPKQDLLCIHIAVIMIMSEEPFLELTLLTDFFQVLIQIILAVIL